MNDRDQYLLRHAMRLAINGRGSTEPNPSVGCVIVKSDRVIGEGFTAPFGGPHAEPRALASCIESPNGATAFASLEPCCHANKKTPPCAPRLIEAKIARVVVGCLDPNPDVDGKGVAMLRGAGIIVDRATPELEAEAKQLIAPFIKRVIQRQPYVTMKWAESSNGKVAGAMGRRVRITSDASDRVVHQLRARCDAIAVGTNTVLADDPLLTARGVEGSRPLLRVVLSNTLNIPLTSKLVTSAREHPVVVYCSESASFENAKQLRDSGVEVVVLPNHDSHFSFADVLSDLHRRSVTHLLVEPGPTLARYMFGRSQADRVWVFRSPKPIEEGNATAAPNVEYPSTGSIEIAGDVLTEYLNPQSLVFFSPHPSADFVLTCEQLNSS
ncbi:MAG: bifunctional diaminohydroxyphosphoribosylaminopyrimidine deaminase/5-amino-6-(5-phosphoribosylamino)uracil reductase RibD [Anaerolineae bacterium]|nr:bifunctional diaminohydroxyphosphoribosylaminopyrimidine deaminase/5-amino-6-(5-phosphoribosylamino)uracil reductase RibD [Phycisphaerae bacterium]